MIKNARNKVKKNKRQTNGKKKEHFGLHRCCAATASELRRWNRISPTLLCLLTQEVGMASKSTKAAENVMLLS
jgi:hypothetical protein